MTETWQIKWSYADRQEESGNVLHTAERVDSSRNYKHPEYRQQWGRVKLRLGFVIVPPLPPLPKNLQDYKKDNL